MTHFLTQLVAGLNGVANTLGAWLLAPVAVVPGWLSVTAVAVATGVVLLLIFKYTSDQRAVKRIKDDMKANLLAQQLFKDSVAVALRAQGGLVAGAVRLLGRSVVPMLVMMVPVALILGQLSLWYQARPLRVGEEAIVTLQLSGPTEAPWPAVRLQPTEAVETTVGPVRVRSQRAVCWKLRAQQAGYHRLVFEAGEAAVIKELAVGDGFLRVSTDRPGWSWVDVLEHPAEEPFGPDAPVRSIEIDYPERPAWFGISRWLYYWFALSMVAAFACRGVFKVNL